MRSLTACNYTMNRQTPRAEGKIILLFLLRVAQLTRFATLGDNASMETPETPAETDLPDRRCTWCGVPMKKRLVGGKRFVHYTCPKCLFQHTIKLSPKLVTPER